MSSIRKVLVTVDVRTRRPRRSGTRDRRFELRGRRDGGLRIRLAGGAREEGGGARARSIVASVQPDGVCIERRLEESEPPTILRAASEEYDLVLSRAPSSASSGTRPARYLAVEARGGKR